MAGNGFGKVVDSGMGGAKFAAVKAVPQVLSGELTVEEGAKQVARAGVQGAVVTGTASAVAGTVASVGAVVGAPVVVVGAVVFGVACAVGSLFDSWFD